MDGTGVLLGLSLFLGYPVLDGPVEHAPQIGFEHYKPIHADRQLHLDNAQVFLRTKTAFDGRLKLRLGVDVTHGAGHITQLQTDASGKLRAVDLDSPGTGIGPIAEANFRVFEQGPLQLNMDVSAAVLIFDRGFPAGGLKYNGKYSVGPSLVWNLGEHGKLTLGGRWMHLSNGHGLVPENPSFEGRGITLRWETPLGKR